MYQKKFRNSSRLNCYSPLNLNGITVYRIVGCLLRQNRKFQFCLKYRNLSSICHAQKTTLKQMMSKENNFTFIQAIVDKIVVRFQVRCQKMSKYVLTQSVAYLTSTISE